MAAHGNFHWTELMTHDVEGAKIFFGGIVGWTYEAMPMGDMTYWIAKKGDLPVGGIFELKGPHFENIADKWVPYLSVDDIDASVKKATADGAKVLIPAMTVPGVGRFGVLQQPGGAVIGFVTPMT
jgi:uncharacterized protein